MMHLGKQRYDSDAVGRGSVYVLFEASVKNQTRKQLSCVPCADVDGYIASSVRLTVLDVQNARLSSSSPLPVPSLHCPFKYAFCFSLNKCHSYSNSFLLFGVDDLQESGWLVFHRALDRLDAAMIAAGEPSSTIGGARNATGRSTRGGVGGVSGGRGGDGGMPGGGDGALGRFCAPGIGGPGSVAMAAQAVAQQSSRLVFEMFYLTDELLYYALKHEGFVGEFALRLANLVYSVVFRHEVREPEPAQIVGCFVSSCYFCRLLFALWVC